MRGRPAEYHYKCCLRVLLRQLGNTVLNHEALVAVVHALTGDVVADSLLHSCWSHLLDASGNLACLVSVVTTSDIDFDAIVADVAVGCGEEVGHIVESHLRDYTVVTAIAYESCTFC